MTSFATTQRDDIQGLRAVAVIAVIACHMGLLSGGFVGVDIFFVISGFLITRNLLRDTVATRKVDLIQFWTRRAKRIVPNATFCLLAVLAFSCLFLPAYRHADIASDVRAAAAFMANRHFAVLGVDYFHRNDLPSPILNYWSLAVEEQFYIFWPFAIGACLLVPQRHFIKAVIAVLCLVIAASYAWCLYTGTGNHVAAYYLTQDRVWQLAIGGLLGTAYPQLIRLPERLRAAAAWLGATASIYAFVGFNEDLSYPGYWALIPTIAAAALILGLDDTTEAAPLRWVLSTEPAKWVGDRSFSLYLWHLPVITFADLYWPDEWFLIPVQLVLTLVLALPAYRCVERRIHLLRFEGIAGLKMIGSALSALVILVALGSAVIAFPMRSTGPDRSVAMAAASKDFPENYAAHCHLTYEQVAQPPCLFGDMTGKKRVVLFGDSHAAQWFRPLVAAAKTVGWQVNSWTKSNCPSADVTVWYQPRRIVFKECDPWREAIFAKLKANPPDVVIMSNWWPYEGELFNRATHKVIHGADAEKVEMMRGTAATIKRLTSYGIRVVLIRDTPRMPKTYGDCLSSGASDCGNPRSSALTDDGQIELARQLGPHVDFNDFGDVFCSATWCPAMIGKKIVYQDPEHITATFSQVFTPEFEHILTRYSDQISSAISAPATAKMR